MISDLICVVSGIIALINGGALVLLYRQYRELAKVTIEFAGLVVASVREEDGELVVIPEVIAGMAVEQLERVHRIVRW